MCDRNQQNCDDKRDHKEQGAHHDLGDLHKMLNKDDNKQGDFSTGMKGDAHGGMQGIQGMQGMKKDDQSCGDKCDKDGKKGECDKKKECH